MKLLVLIGTFITLGVSGQSSEITTDSSHTRKTIFFNEDLLLVLEQQQRESLIFNEVLIKNISSIHKDEITKMHKKTIQTWGYMEQLKSYLVSTTGGLDRDGYSAVARYDCTKIEEMVCDSSGKNLFRLAETMINDYLKLYPSELHDIDSFEFEFESSSEAYKPVDQSEKTRVDIKCMNLLEAQYLLTIMQLKVVGKERNFITSKMY